MRIVVFGANGPTGRQVVSQAVGAGHEVAAVTRHPWQIQARERLAVVRADARDEAAVDGAVAGAGAVLSALGVSYTRQPVSVYSAGTGNIIAAMGRHGVRRLVVAGTAAATGPATRRCSPG
jgi:putative NADH-flavin reductase